MTRFESNGSGGGAIAPDHDGHHDHHRHHHRRHRAGLVTRLSPIKGVTESRALPHAVYLPVVLNNVTVSMTALHNEYDTLAAGQFSEAPSGGKDATQLREVPLDTLTMDWEPSWFSTFGEDHKSVGGALERILDWRTPVLLTITRHPHRTGAKPVLRMHVTLRSLTREERPGEPDTRYLSMDVKQWRNASVARQAHHQPNLPTTHKLKADDTLRSLSKAYYGSYKHWRRIRDANGIPHKFGGDTPIVRMSGKWKVGYKIKIPRLAPEEKKGHGSSGKHRGPNTGKKSGG